MHLPAWEGGEHGAVGGSEAGEIDSTRPGGMEGSNGCPLPAPSCGIAALPSPNIARGATPPPRKLEGVEFRSSQDCIHFLNTNNAQVMAGYMETDRALLMFNQILLCPTRDQFKLSLVEEILSTLWGTVY